MGVSEFVRNRRNGNMDFWRAKKKETILKRKEERSKETREEPAKLSIDETSADQSKTTTQRRQASNHTDKLPYWQATNQTRNQLNKQHSKEANRQPSKQTSREVDISK